MASVVGLDIGTTTICAVVWAPDRGDLIAVRSVPNAARVAGLPRGHDEQDAECIWSSVCELLRSTLALPAVRGSGVKSIALTGQMHGVLLADASLRARTPLITWRDQRMAVGAGAERLARARDRLGAGYAVRSGCDLHVGYGGATLCWLAAEGRLSGGLTALGIADFVQARLTGALFSEPTAAASWGLLDVHRLDWDAQIVEALRIPEEVLPDLRPSGAACGKLLSERADELGCACDTAVHAPLGDNQASVIGAGGGRAGVAVLNLGTGGQLSVPRECPEHLPGLETRPMPGGGYIVVGASLSAGAAYASLCRFFRACVRELTDSKLGTEDLYAQLNRLAAAAPPGAEGLRADTRLLGTRSDPLRRGGLSGLDSTNLTPSNLARAFCEGLIEELAEAAARIGMGGIREIAAGGNAVRKNPLLIELIANRFGLPCALSPHTEEAAAGAARWAAMERSA